MASKRVKGARALRVVGRVFMVVAVLMVAIALAFAALEWSANRTGRAEGSIIAFEYGPVVRFEVAGRTAQFASGIRSSRYRVGDRVPVAFQPNNPADAAIDGFAGRWFLPGLFCILSLVFVAVGGALALLGRARRLAMAASG